MYLSSIDPCAIVHISLNLNSMCYVQSGSDGQVVRGRAFLHGRPFHYTITSGVTVIVANFK